MQDPKYAIGDLVTVTAKHIPNREDTFTVLDMGWERGGYTYKVSSDGDTGWFTREAEMSYAEEKS